MCGALYEKIVDISKNCETSLGSEIQIQATPLISWRYLWDCLVKQVSLKYPQIQSLGDSGFHWVSLKK